MFRNSGHQQAKKRFDDAKAEIEIYEELEKSHIYPKSILLGIWKEPSVTIEGSGGLYGNTGLGNIKDLYHYNAGCTHIYTIEEVEKENENISKRNVQIKKEKGKKFKKDDLLELLDPTKPTKNFFKLAMPFVLEVENSSFSEHKTVLSFITDKYRVNIEGAFTAREITIPDPSNPMRSQSTGKIYGYHDTKVYGLNDGSSCRHFFHGRTLKYIPKTIEEAFYLMRVAKINK